MPRRAASRSRSAQVRTFTARHLHGPGGVLVVDETGDLKKDT
ncbi:hypothetical protein [Streptomyces colonosanans]|nr:hypothetical protein [Streptomyces colonosanans]